MWEDREKKIHRIKSIIKRITNPIKQNTWKKLIKWDKNVYYSQEKVLSDTNHQGNINKNQNG